MVDNALKLKSAADACPDELPIQLTAEHDQVAKVMNEDEKLQLPKRRRSSNQVSSIRNVLR